MKAFWLCIIALCLLCGCSDAARQVQIHLADATAEGANAGLPVLISAYDAEGVAVIQAAKTREEAEAGVAEVKARWAPVWAAWEVLRLAQDVWATALEDGSDLTAALKAVKEGYCGLKAVWPKTIPAVPLVPVKCAEAAP